MHKQVTGKLAPSSEFALNYSTLLFCRLGLIQLLGTPISWCALLFNVRRFLRRRRFV